MRFSQVGVVFLKYQLTEPHRNAVILLEFWNFFWIFCVCFSVRFLTETHGDFGHKKPRDCTVQNIPIGICMGQGLSRFLARFVHTGSQTVGTVWLLIRGSLICKIFRTVWSATSGSDRLNGHKRGCGWRPFCPKGRHETGFPKSTHIRTFCLYAL